MKELSRILRITRTILIHRLQQLQRTLDELAGRVHQAVAQALGQTLGAVVREAAEAVLQTEAERYRGPPPDYDQPADHWHYGSQDQPWEEWEENGSYGHTTRPATDPDPGRSSRWLRALAAGLRAGAWWLTRSSGQWLLAGTLSLGLVAGSVVYLGGWLLDHGLEAVDSASHRSSAAYSTHTSTTFE